MNAETAKTKKRTLREKMSLRLRGIRLAFRIYGAKNILLRAAMYTSEYLPSYFEAFVLSLIVNELAGEAREDRLTQLVLLALGGYFLLYLFARWILFQERSSRIMDWRKDQLYLLSIDNRISYAHVEDPEIRRLRQRIQEANKNVNGVTCYRFFLAEAIPGAFNVLLSLSLFFTLFAPVENAEATGFGAFLLSAPAPFVLILLVLIAAFFAARLRMRAGMLSEKEYGNMSYLSMLSAPLFTADSDDIAIYNLKAPILGIMRKRVLGHPFLKRIMRIQNTHDALIALLDGLLLALALYFVAARTALGVYAVGSFLLYRNALTQLFSGVSFLFGALGYMSGQDEFMEELYRYLDLPDTMYKGTLAMEKRDDNRFEIEFQNVSFKYPGSEEYALRNVDLKFTIGERLALVGMNGSGKTTLIKLLCRLYDPTEGKILLNGIDITRYSYDEYIALFSVVFQDFKIFAFSVAENVACTPNPDRERVDSVLREVGMADKVASMPHGMDTAVTREYEDDGVDLSGGEGQKIAIARALYKDAPFLILDEPTAALDPLAEAEIYGDLDKMAEDRTTVFISHRLSSCRFCDEIAVFDHGRIVERGNHKTLLSHNGKYAELWNAQAKYYVDSPAKG